MANKRSNRKPRGDGVSLAISEGGMRIIAGAVVTLVIVGLACYFGAGGAVAAAVAEAARKWFGK